MNDILTGMLIVGVWLFVQLVVLPKLGVPT
jgi:hypothetical protein